MASVDLKDDRSEIVHYNFEDHPIYMRKALLSSYNNFEAPPHWHNDIEFIAVLHGEMNYNINGNIITLRQNEGVFVNSRQLHYGFSESKTECSFICILIHPMLLCVSQRIEQKFVVPLLEDQNVPYIKMHADISWHKQLLECIKSMYAARDDAAAPLAVCSLFMKMWAIILSRTNTSSAHSESKNTDLTILRNMIGYIQRYYRDKITLSDIALSGAVGQSKCCKLFDKYMGTTPNAYLIRYRLHQSTWYLINTDMTVTEIAQTVGFSGSSYYAEAFRKWCAQSPSEYRKAKRI